MSDYTWPDGVGYIGLALFLAGVVFIIVSLAGVGTETVFIQETEPAYTRSIVATNAEAMVSGRGSSFRGTGSFVIGHDNVFRVYQVDEGGGITLVEIPSDKTTIYFVEEGEEPSITFVNCLFAKNKYFFWEEREEERFEKVDRYVLRVPKGTISDFTFD